MDRPPRHLRAKDDRGNEVRLSPKAERGPSRLSSAAIVLLVMAASLAAGALVVGPELALFAGPWIALLLLAEFRYLGPRRAAQVEVEQSLALRRCPCCLYSLAGLNPAADGCAICPECGAAWRPRGVEAAGATVP